MPAPAPHGASIAFPIVLNDDDLDAEATDVEADQIPVGSEVKIVESGDLHLSVGTRGQTAAIFILDSRAVFRSSEFLEALAKRVRRKDAERPGRSVSFFTLNLPEENKLHALRLILEVVHAKFNRRHNYLPSLAELTRMLDLVNYYKISGMDYLTREWWQRRKNRLTKSYPWKYGVAVTALRCAWEAKDGTFFSQVAKYLAWNCRVETVEVADRGPERILCLTSHKITDHHNICMTDIEGAIISYRKNVMRALINMLKHLVESLILAEPITAETTNAATGTKRKAKTAGHPCQHGKDGDACSAYTLGLLIRQLKGCSVWPLPNAELCQFHFSLESLHKNIVLKMHGAISREVSLHRGKSVGACNPLNRINEKFWDFHQATTLSLTARQAKHFGIPFIRVDLKTE